MLNLPNAPAPIEGTPTGSIPTSGTPPRSTPTATALRRGDEYRVVPDSQVDYLTTQGYTVENKDPKESAGFIANRPLTPEPVTPPVVAPEPPPPTKTEKASSNAEQALTDSAEFYQSQYEKLQSEFDNYTADIEKIDSEQAPIFQEIRETFQRRIDEMGKVNQAMEARVGISGLRGMARYAPQTQQGFVSNEITNGMNRIKGLESEKLRAIEQAKIALKSQAKDRWQTFNEFMNSAGKAYENKKQAVLDLHSFLKNEEDRLADQKLADIKLQQIEDEQEVATAENIAGGIYSAIGDDIDANMEYITNVAKEYDLDPNILMSTIRAYEQEDRENQLALQKDLIDMAAKLEEGETMEVYPGIIITGTKDKDEKWVQTIVGNTKYNDLYVKEDGVYVRKQRIEGQAYKYTAPKQEDPDKLTDEEKKFQDDLASSISNLSSEDVDWGNVYNEMAVKYRTSSPELFQELDDEQKKAVEEAYGGAVRFNENDNTVMDVLLGKEYYYPKE